MPEPNLRCEVCGEQIEVDGAGYRHAEPLPVDDPDPDHTAVPTDPAIAAEIDGYVAEGWRQ